MMRGFKREIFQKRFDSGESKLVTNKTGYASDRELENIEYWTHVGFNFLKGTSGLHLPIYQASFASLQTQAYISFCCLPTGHFCMQKCFDEDNLEGFPNTTI